MGYTQHSTFPAAIKDYELSLKSQQQRDGGHSSSERNDERVERWIAGDDNPELVVRPEQLLHPAGEPALQTVNAHQVCGTPVTAAHWRHHLWMVSWTKLDSF